MNSTYSRTRVKTDATTSLLRYDWFRGTGCGYTTSPNSNYPCSFATTQFSSYESMADNVSRRGRKNRNPTDCSHYKLTYHGVGYVRHPSSYNAGVHILSALPAASPQEVVNSMSTIPDNVFQTFLVDAFNDFTTQFPEELSIGNFLVELREVSSLLPRIAKTFTKSASGGYLNWSFGWKPLLSDLEKLSNLLKVVQERLAYLRSTYGKWTRLGLYRGNAWVDPKLNSATPVTSPVAAGQSALELIPETSRIDFRAGGWLYHELRYLDETVSTVQAFMGALGLNNPLKIVWNAIPYSFVVDWFLDIGSLIDRFLSAQDQTSVWRVDRTSCSSTRTDTIGVYQVTSNLTCTVPNSYRTRLGFYSYEGYNRYAGLPLPTSLLNLQELTPRQLTLLGALAVAK